MGNPCEPHHRDDAKPRLDASCEAAAETRNRAVNRFVHHRESAETYRGELVRLGSYRIAVCRDGLQWLFQRQRPGFAGVGTAWDTLGYCMTREALIRLHRSYTGCDAPKLHELPQFFPREAAK